MDATKSRLLRVVVLIVSLLLCSITIFGNTSDKFVSTPFGSRPASCVFPASQLQQIKSPCYLSLASSKKIIKSFPEGWAVYASVKTPHPITSYNGTWSVPPPPTDKSPQILYMFTGLQNSLTTDSAVLSIIQPVLQWGISEAGGGEYWSLASWYVDELSNAYYSKLIKTESGNKIVGIMYKVDKIWTIISIDATASLNTTLQIATNSTEIAAFVTLEVYNVDKCSDYPTYSDNFTELSISTTKGLFTPNWTANVLSHACKETVDIVNSSSVTLTF